MLSIIIITKNEEVCLPKLLQSLQNQTFKNYEIIVSDAQSNDQTRKIANDYGCQVVEGGLPSIGRNNGAKIAQGDILLFLDADIILPLNFIKDTLQEFTQKKLGLATVNYLPLSNKLIDKILLKLYNNFAKIIQFFDPHAAGMCIFCRQDIFRQTNGFNEKLLLGEDYEFCRRAGRLGKFRMLKSSFIFFDIRRFENDGRLNFVLKCFKGFFHRLFIGEQYQPLFKYELHGGVEVQKIYQEFHQTIIKK